MITRSGMIGLAIAAAVIASCTKEARTLASDQPQTPPEGAGDPRARRYQDNYYQVSQGGLYFTLYGCGTCHGTDATGALNLADGKWRRGGGIDAVYRSIAAGHPAGLPSYGDRIPVEILWQMTAFVRGLPKNDPARNRRNEIDQEGEPQGGTWQGPLL